MPFNAAPTEITKSGYDMNFDPSPEHLALQTVLEGRHSFDTSYRWQSRGKKTK